MIPKLKLKEGNVIVTPAAEYNIRHLMPDGGMALQDRATGGSLFMSMDEFLSQYARREAWLVRSVTSADLDAEGNIRKIAEEPDIVYGPKARIRRLMLQEYDASPVNLSNVALKNFVATVKLPEELERANWRPSAGTLRRDIQRYGSPDHRPLRLMVRKSSRTPTRRFPAGTEKLLDDIVPWFYEERHRSVGDAYNKLLTLLEDEDKRLARNADIFGQTKRPSYETVRTRIRANENFDFWKQKFGEKDARRRYKGIGGGRYAKRPLDVVMIDATIVDTILVINGEKRILGRPTLHVAIDVCTRMILGIFVSFEPTSIHALMNCIKQVLTPKEDLIRKRFPDLREPFVAYGKPNLLIADNGLENVGSSFQDSMRDVGISVEWAPIKTPEYKQYVERFFETINSYLFHKIAGGVPARPTEMRDLEINPSKEACVSLETLEELIYQFLVEVYQYETHRGIEAQPLDRWQKLTQEYGIDVIDDLTVVDEACGYARHAVLTRKGIQVEGLAFHDPAITGHLLADLLPISERGHRHKARNSVNVKIKLDPSDISRIHVWNKESRQYQELPNTHQTYSAGTSLWLHRYLKKMAIQDQQAFRSDEDQARAKDRLLTNIEKHKGGGHKRLSSQVRESSPIVEEHVARQRHDGRANSIPVNTGMGDRADDGRRPDGFLRGREKGNRTRSAKKAERASAMRRASAGLQKRSETSNSPLVGDPKEFLKSLPKDEWGDNAN